MASHNTLELARQGDPIAIATILSYHLSRRYNTTASVIRLGDYLSVFIEATFAADQTMLVTLVLGILQSLNINTIATLEICAQERGDREVRWSQTIDLANAPVPAPTMTQELTNLDLLQEDSSSAIVAPETPASNTTTGVAAYPPASVSAPPGPSSAIATVEEPDISLQTLFKRPEMVALVAFALMLVLWDSYLEWVEDPDPHKPLSSGKLARRLGVKPKTLRRYQHRPNFTAWSQDLDPDGIAWVYEGPLFVPRAG